MRKTWPRKRGRTSRKAKEISSSKIILASISRETILQKRQGSSLAASSLAVSSFADSLRGRDFLMGTRLILRERLENRVRKTRLPFAANATRSEKAAAVSSNGWCRIPRPNRRSGFQLPSAWEINRRECAELDGPSDR